MENKMKYGFSLFIVISAVLTGCTKTEDFPSVEPVNQRFAQSMAWNKIHPAREIVVQTASYSILTIADSHVGGTKNLDSFFKIAEKSPASAVVMAGDLTAGTKEDYDIFESHLPFQDSLPILPIIGNHDLFNNCWEEFYKRFGSSSYLFTVKTPEGTDLFICLDTGSGTLGSKQLEWMTFVLQTMRPEYRHCIVFTHNNFFQVRHTLGSPLMVEELNVLFDLFTKYNVEMVITGHDHEKDVKVFGKTTYIQIEALKDGFNHAGYLNLIVKKDSLNYEFHRIL
jgi:predicted phosphodiesterase